MNRNQHLQDVLESHRMKHVQTFVDKMTSRKNEIATFLKEQYGSDAYDTFNSGSMAKHTATNIKFDMDIVIPFRHEAFDTLQGMYDDVFEKLNDKYEEEAEKVRKQKVSIGISFKKSIAFLFLPTNELIPIEANRPATVAIAVAQNDTSNESKIDKYNCLFFNSS